MMKKADMDRVFIKLLEISEAAGVSFYRTDGSSQIASYGFAASLKTSASNLGFTAKIASLPHVSPNSSPGHVLQYLRGGKAPTP